MQIDFTEEALKSSSSFVREKFNTSFRPTSLRPYFTVDDTYLIQKISLILYPFSSSSWSTPNPVTRPELYLPIMSILSYILLRAFYSGLEGTFTPGDLSLIFSRMVVFEVILLILTRVIAYFLGIGMVSLDMVAYSGYKYLIVLLLHMCRFRVIKIIFSLYLYTSFFFFLSRSLRGMVVGDEQRNKRVYFLFFIVCIQIGVVYVLSYK